MPHRQPAVSFTHRPAPDQHVSDPHPFTQNFPRSMSCHAEKAWHGTGFLPVVSAPARPVNCKLNWEAVQVERGASHPRPASGLPAMALHPQRWLERARSPEHGQRFRRPLRKLLLAWHADITKPRRDETQAVRTDLRHGTQGVHTDLGSRDVLGCCPYNGFATR